MSARGGTDATAAPEVVADWLLSAAERGNPATAIDAGHDGGRAWTVGNLVQVHVDGAATSSGCTSCCPASAPATGCT
ncbi:MAG TPA: hypothetical protein VF486_28050 [Actinomycetes bacterium]